MTPCTIIRRLALLSDAAHYSDIIRRYALLSDDVHCYPPRVSDSHSTAHEHRRHQALRDPEIRKIPDPRLYDI